MLGLTNNPHGEETPMPETPTFGRYAEIPYDRMTPEQQQGYRSLIETRGRLAGPNKIYVHNPNLVKVMGPLGAYFRTGYSLSRARARDRGRHHQQQISFGLSDQRA